MSINYTYTYLGVDYTGMSAITFRAAEPKIEDGTEQGKRLVIFEGGTITSAHVTKGDLTADKLSIDKTGGTVSLDMRDVPPGTAVTAEVTLTMNGREHVVTVTITAEEQDGNAGMTLAAIPPRGRSPQR